MVLRGAMLVLAGALLAGCANSQPLSSGFADAGPGEPSPSAIRAKKTMASKVLSAIALGARHGPQARSRTAQRV